MKNVRVITNGCPENRIDSARIIKYLEKNDWHISSKISDSDLVIFNTCGLSEFAQVNSIDIIKEIETLKKKDSSWLVCGCLPKINLELLRDHYSGPVFGSDDLFALKNILDLDITVKGVHANSLIPKYSMTRNLSKRLMTLKLSSFFSINRTVQRILKLRYHKLYRKMENEMSIHTDDSFAIKVSTGCLNSCAFCAW